MISFKLLRAAFIVSLVFCGGGLMAQNKKLSLEDIYTNNAYKVENIGQIRWMKDNQSYSTLEPNTEGKGMNIVRHEVISGNSTILVRADQLRPPGHSTSLKIDDYIWSDDNSQLLIFTNTRKAAFKKSGEWGLSKNCNIANISIGT